MKERREKRMQWIKRTGNGLEDEMKRTSLRTFFTTHFLHYSFFASLFFLLCLSILPSLPLYSSQLSLQKRKLFQCIMITLFSPSLLSPSFYFDPLLYNALISFHCIHNFASSDITASSPPHTIPNAITIIQKIVAESKLTVCPMYRVYRVYRLFASFAFVATIHIVNSLVCRFIVPLSHKTIKNSYK